MHPTARFILPQNQVKQLFSAITPADPGIMLATLKVINLSSSLPLPGENVISMLSPCPAR